MKIVEILSETPHNIPTSQKWSLDKNLTDNKKSVEKLIRQISYKGLKPKIKNIPLDKVLATQNQVDLEHGGEGPILSEYDKYPVVLYDDKFYHIIDGHHRIYYAITAGSHEITAYVFNEEEL